MKKIPLMAARVAAGITQGEMAEKLGVSRTQISKIERGLARPRTLYVYAYSHVTGFSVDDFLLPEEFTKSEVEEQK